MPQEPQTKETPPTSIEYAILLGNYLRKQLNEGLSNRKIAIAHTKWDTPQYQARLNFLEANLLQAIASVIQDHLSELTYELEMERQQRRPAVKVTGLPQPTSLEDELARRSMDLQRQIEETDERECTAL